MVSLITMVMMATDMATVVEVREARDPRAVDIPMVASQASRTIPRRRTIIPPRVPRMEDMEEMVDTVMMMTAAMDMTRRAPRTAAMMDITDPRGQRMAVTAMVDMVVMMAATMVTRRAPRMMDMEDITSPRGRRTAAVTAMKDMVVMMMADMDMTRRAPRMMVAMMDITNPRGLRMVVTVMEDTVVVMAVMMDMTRRVPRMVAAVTEGTMTRWNMPPDMMMMDMTPRDRRMVAAMEGMVTVMVDTELYELLPFKPRERREKSSPPSPTTS
jgi:hypothetical protein